MFAILLLPKSRDRNIADRRLEFDQRMGTVMAIAWECFAFGAEVGIVADGALVSISDNVVFVVLAQWAIAIDVVVNRSALAGERDGLVEGDEPMA